MKRSLFLSVFAMLGMTAVPAFAADSSATFKIRVQPGLTHLLPVPGVPGVVRSEGTPASADETVTLILSDCTKLVSGEETCGGQWSKQLTKSGTTMSYFVNVWKKAGTDEHTIILNICPTGQASLSECPGTQSTVITVHGATVPELNMFPTQDENTAPFFQPNLGIRQP